MIAARATRAANARTGSTAPISATAPPATMHRAPQRRRSRAAPAVREMATNAPPRAAPMVSADIPIWATEPPATMEMPAPHPTVSGDRARAPISAPGRSQTAVATVAKIAMTATNAPSMIAMAPTAQPMTDPMEPPVPAVPEVVREEAAVSQIAPVNNAAATVVVVPAEAAELMRPAMCRDNAYVPRNAARAPTAEAVPPIAPVEAVCNAPATFTAMMAIRVHRIFAVGEVVPIHLLTRSQSADPAHNVMEPGLAAAIAGQTNNVAILSSAQHQAPVPIRIDAMLRRQRSW